MSIRDWKRNGIPLKKSGFAIFVCIFFMSVFGLCSNVFLKFNYEKLLRSSHDYMLSNQAAISMQEGSDYLTDQLRLFVFTLDLQSMNNYFTELNYIRRRENAVETINKYKISDEAVESLNHSLRESDELIKYELYIFRLVVDALGESKIDVQVPERLESVFLSAEDSALSVEKKISKAKRLVFDDYYRNKKYYITAYKYQAINDLLQETESNRKKDETVMDCLLFTSIFAIVCILVLSVATFSLIMYSVIRPLNRHLKRIRDGEKLDVIGSREFKFLSKTFNEMWNQSQQSKILLKHKAEHDNLTGLINREAFSHLKHALECSETKVALLIIDVDRFKEINDTFGHLTGDRVLQKISQVLMEFFRNTDFVARIGGDEFAVILTQFESGIDEIVSLKIKKINEILKNSQSDIPSVSLSVGIAISEKGFPEKLFKEADSALYSVKRNGRSGYSFYNQGMKMTDYMED